MAYTPQTPPLNPPPPSDPRSLADTPNPAANYDVVIDGNGYMLFRGLHPDSDSPSQTFQTEADDMSYAPVFIDRTNVQGNYGDDTQAFFMTYSQKDWSGGSGQKFYRTTDPQNRMFFTGKQLMPTITPGQVTVGPLHSNLANFNSGFSFRNFLYWKNTTNDVTTPPSSLTTVTSSSGNTVVLEYLSYVPAAASGGVMTWAVQPTSGATKWLDCVDAVAGDDGYLYYLEANTASASKIHSLNGLSSATLAWTNATLAKNCNSIEYYNGFVYVATVGAQLRQISGATPGLGGAITEVTIKDFGGGVIIDLQAGGGFLWILYANPDGDYKLFTYDGSAVTHVANLPSAWSEPATAETGILGLGKTTEATFQHRSVSCLHYQDGVLYVAGLMPVADRTAANVGANTLITTLWYYASGNTGILWQPQRHSQTSAQSPSSWGGTAVTGVGGGLIVFADPMNQRLMGFDPAAGSAFPLGDMPRTTLISVGGNTISSVSGGLTATSFTINDATGAIRPGMVGVISTEYMYVISVTRPTGTTTTVNVARGVMGTTSRVTLANGNTITFNQPEMALGNLVFDPTNSLLVGTHCKDEPSASSDSSSAPGVNDWPYRGWYFNLDSSNVGLVSDQHGLLITSQYDFDSSLNKYFRGVKVDGELDQLGSDVTAGGYTSTPGQMKLYYKLDGSASTTTDAGVVALNSGATCSMGTEYTINAQGKTLTVLVEMISTATTTRSVLSYGPAVRKVSVRGVPVLPAYRNRHYALALFNNEPLNDGRYDNRTPAVIRKALEASMTASLPVSVSDATMSGVSMVFDMSNCKIREVKPDEWVAFVGLREV